jgi:hypothetical protein
MYNNYSGIILWSTDKRYARDKIVPFIGDYKVKIGWIEFKHTALLFLAMFR